MITVDSSAWIVCPVILPLAGAISCFLFRRGAVVISLIVALVNLVGVVILAGQLLRFGPARYQVGEWAAPLGITLCTDGPSLLMLAMTAVTGFGITVYAWGYFSARRVAQACYFWPLWMMLWAALNGLFLSGDFFNLYVTLELVGVSAAALAALSGSPASQVAAFRYLLVSLLGSLSYLLGVVLLYKMYAVLDLELVRMAVTPQPGVWAALALMTVGLLLKTALFPLHFWLPPAHANAMAPVSAILSSLVVKGSFYLLFRFWFDIFQPIVSFPALGVLGWLGAAAVLWGGVQAMRQQRLKLLIAYSTVAQLGYLFIAFPLALDVADHQVWSAVLFMAMAHACAKAAMFMAAGTISLHLGHDRINDMVGIRAALPVTVFAYAVAGVNLMGLPPSGGFMAKWLLLNASLTTARWWWGLVIVSGSLLAAAYVYRVVSRLFVIPEGWHGNDRSRPISGLLEWPALALALMSLLLGMGAPVLMQFLSQSTTVVAGILPGGGP